MSGTFVELVREREENYWGDVCDIGLWRTFAATLDEKFRQLADKPSAPAEMVRVKDCSDEKELIGKVGKVRQVRNYDILVEFEGWNKGHNGNLGDLVANRWYIANEDLEDVTAPVSSEWKTMDSAPRDGTKFLYADSYQSEAESIFWDKDKCMFAMSWNGDDPMISPEGMWLPKPRSPFQG